MSGYASVVARRLFKPGQGLLLLAVTVAALNLRPALSGASPLLDDIRSSTGISGMAAGLLTTLPVLFLGISSFIAPALARRLGTQATLTFMLFLLAAGAALRGVAGIVGLFGGTLMAGAAIGVIGALLPAVIKREFAQTATRLMTLYTAVLMVGAAVAAALAVPVKLWFDDNWRPAIALLPGIFALVGGAVWLAVRERGPQASSPMPTVHGLWRDPLAWWITAFMGLQSTTAYVVFAWLPAVVHDRGLSEAQAGAVLSVSLLVQFVGAVVVPITALRLDDQRGLAVVLMAAIGAGLLGTFVGPISQVWLWAVVLGFGNGGAFALALNLLVLRSADGPTTAQLSSMSQAVGYTFAALGPLSVGLLHDLTGRWTEIAWLLAALCLMGGFAGWAAGRNGLVLKPASRRFSAG